MNSTTTKQVAYSGPPEFQAIAEQNTVLRGQVGSGLHGVTTGADDRDEMGVCIEPPEYVIGNARFEQYQFRTQPEGVRSGAGDLDLVVYSLRKWARLTAAGNPTVLLLLFLPEHEIVTNTWWGGSSCRPARRCSYRSRPATASSATSNRNGTRCSASVPSAPTVRSSSTFMASIRSSRTRGAPRTARRRTAHHRTDHAADPGAGPYVVARAPQRRAHDRRSPRPDERTARTDQPPDLNQCLAGSA